MIVSALLAPVLLALGFASGASAQPIAGVPVPPGTYGEVLADGYGIAAESVEGGAIGVRSRGGVAVHEALELGGGWGWRASWLGARDLGAIGRLGFVPWRVWAGTGFRWDGGAFGARLAASLGPRLAGVAQLDAGGEAWSLGLALSAGHAWPGIEARLDADVVWLNREAPSVAYGAALAIVAGDADAPVRPAGALEVRGSNDLGASPRLRLGVWIAPERGWAVRAMAYSTLPDDREGLRVGLEIALLIQRIRR